MDNLGGDRTDHQVDYRTLATGSHDDCVAPRFVDMLRNPQPAAGKVWAGFTVANVLAFFGGTAMTVEERLVPVAFIGLCGLMAVACWWPAKK